VKKYKIKHGGPKNKNRKEQIDSVNKLSHRQKKPHST